MSQASFFGGLDHMKVLIAMDAYFNILQSHHANQFVHDGIKQVIPDANIVMVPLFLSHKDIIDSLLIWDKGKKIHKKVTEDIHNQSQKDITLGLIGNALIIDGKNTIGNSTSSYALGEAMMYGLDLMVQEMIISIGNVNSYDLGAGMLQALGAKFYDRNGALMKIVTRDDLKLVRGIDVTQMDDRLAQTKITLVSDETYHLFGKSSQIAKSDAAETEKQYIDNSIWYLNEQFKKVNVFLDANKGDAGGIQAVMTALFNAETKTSQSLIFERTDLLSLLREADLVVYGGANGTAHSSLVANALYDAHDGTNLQLYLTAGKSYSNITQKENYYQFNVYPEVTESTEDIHIGMQLTDVVSTFIRLQK